MDFCQNFKFLYRFCNLFVFSFYPMGFLVKVSNLLDKLHQICWFSGCDLHLPEAPGLRKPLAILQGQKEINVPFLCKKESHCDHCTYRGFLFLHILHCFWKVGVLRVPYVIVFKMQKILYLFWFQKVIFFCLVAGYGIGIYSKVHFCQNCKFFKGFVICLCFDFTELDFLLKEVTCWTNFISFLVPGSDVCCPGVLLCHRNLLISAFVWKLQIFLMVL